MTRHSKRAHVRTLKIQRKAYAKEQSTAQRRRKQMHMQWHLNTGTEQRTGKGKCQGTRRGKAKERQILTQSKALGLTKTK
jgi:hypothetical protein